MREQPQFLVEAGLENFLLNRQLVAKSGVDKSIKIKNAALLLFAKSISHYFP